MMHGNLKIAEADFITIVAEPYRYVFASELSGVLSIFRK